MVLSASLVLVVLLASSGVLAGVIIGKLASYEINEAKKWLVIVQAFLAALLLALGLMLFKIQFWLLLSIAIFSFLFLLLNPNVKKDLILYLLSGIFIGASKGTGLHFYISSIVFAYGLALGPLIRKNWALHLLAKTLVLISSSFATGVLIQT